MQKVFCLLSCYLSKKPAEIAMQYNINVLHKVFHQSQIEILPVTSVKSKNTKMQFTKLTELLSLLTSCGMQSREVLT